MGESRQSVGRQPGTRLRPGRGWLVWLVAEILVLAAAVYFLIPQIAGLEQVGRVIATAAWWAVFVALALEAVALYSYVGLLATALHVMGARPPRSMVLRVVLAGVAVGKTLPGGTSAAFPFSIHALRIAGVDPAIATAAVAGSGMLSSTVLAALLPIAAVVALFGGTLPLAANDVLITLGALVFAAWVVVALRDPALIVRAVRKLTSLVARGPLRRRLDPDRLAGTVERAVRGLHDLAATRAIWRALPWAMANWLFDFGAFVVMAVAIGQEVPLWGLLLVFVLGQMTAGVPLTPGAVGVIEAAMTAALIAVGAPAASAAATVLAWRLVSHWIPIAVGLGFFATLPTGNGRKID